MRNVLIESATRGVHRADLATRLGTMGETRKDYTSGCLTLMRESRRRSRRERRRTRDPGDHAVKSSCPRLPRRHEPRHPGTMRRTANGCRRRRGGGGGSPLSGPREDGSSGGTREPTEHAERLRTINTAVSDRLLIGGARNRGADNRRQHPARRRAPAAKSRYALAKRENSDEARRPAFSSCPGSPIWPSHGDHRNERAIGDSFPAFAPAPT